jgi:hypothetical protein
MFAGNILNRLMRFLKPWGGWECKEPPKQLPTNKSRVDKYKSLIGSGQRVKKPEYLKK